MIKIFVSDMDGTLLHDPENMHSKEMPLENKEAVLKLHASGVRFMMASGRDVYYRHVLEKDLGFQVDAIGMNGCNVVIDNEQLCNHGLSRQDAIDIIETITHLPVKSNVLGITSNGDYVFQHLDQEPYEFFKNLAKEGIFQDVPDIDLVTWIHDETKAPFNKVVALVFSVEDRDTLFHYFKSHFDGRFDVIYSGPHNVEIMPKHISKGQALLELMELKGYAPTEVAVIGDSMNDISMLQAVPYSYAMSHADDIVIHAAHYVVHSVKEAIDQVLEINEREKHEK